MRMHSCIGVCVCVWECGGTHFVCVLYAHILSRSVSPMHVRYFVCNVMSYQKATGMVVFPLGLRVWSFIIWWIMRQLNCYFDCGRNFSIWCLGAAIPRTYVENACRVTRQRRRYSEITVSNTDSVYSIIRIYIYLYMKMASATTARYLAHEEHGRCMSYHDSEYENEC